MKELCEDDFTFYRSCLLEMGFYEVIEKGMFIGLEDEKVYLTHRPTDCKREYFNLFGHIHNLCKVKEFGVNIGTDNYHYCPIPVEEVLFFKNAIKDVYDEDVFIREI
ncbi:MAG: hypothetical protein LBD11_06900 [Candidatus Peribacteria bacterium]|jgi:calcineurin-like phosphoesterase family protein|nr:hypothetical protein [Candidatus Peribacteria bacterium]